MAKTAPCKNCKDRVVGCHSECEKYAEFVEYRKELNHNRICDTHKPMSTRHSQELDKGKKYI